MFQHDSALTFYHLQGARKLFSMCSLCFNSHSIRS